VGAKDVVVQEDLGVYLVYALGEMGQPQIHLYLQNLIKKLDSFLDSQFSFINFIKLYSAFFEFKQVFISEVVDEYFLDVGGELGVISEEASDEVFSQKLVVVNHLDKIDFDIDFGFYLVRVRHCSDGFVANVYQVRGESVHQLIVDLVT